MAEERTTDEIFEAARNAIERRANEIRKLCGLDVDVAVRGGATISITLAGGLTASGAPPMPLSFDLEPKIIYRLYTLNRVGLALEHEVLAPEWVTVFDSDTRSRASRNLATVERLAYLDAMLQGGRSADSEVAIIHDRLVVAGGRVTWVYDTPYPSGNPETQCEFSEQLELELMSDPLLPYSPKHHQHVLFCPHCRSRAPFLADVYERIVDLDLKLLVARLEALASIQQLDDDRIEEFLSRQKPGAGEDWLHASELLGWRAIVAGDYLSRLIQLGHLAPESEDCIAPVWSVFTAGNGHPKVVDLFRRLDRELLRAGVASLLLSRMYIDTYFDREGDFKIPTDGDLRPYAWAIPVSESPDFESWEELLAYTPGDRSDPFYRELVEVVKIAASNTVADERIDGQTEAPSGPKDDLLRNTHDMLWVTSRRIEEALPPTHEYARDSLSRLLGSDVLGRLDPGARQNLIEAEWIFLTGRSPMPALREIAQAFEHHVRARVVPLLPDSFPRGKKRNGRNPGLSEIENAVGCCSGSESERLKRAGLDPKEVARAINRVRKPHGDYKHVPSKAKLCGEEVREIRETWYGLKPEEPGVFHLITGVRTT